MIFPLVLIAVSRTAFDDNVGGSHNQHDANYFTFHRIKNFRKLTMADSVTGARLNEKAWTKEEMICKRQPYLGLSTKFATWPRLLAEAGYATALIGKWHLGKQDEHHSTRYGYGEFKGFRIGGDTSQNPKVEIDGKVKRVDGYTPDILTDFGGLTPDLLHPADNGMIRMGENLARKLKEIIG